MQSDPRYAEGFYDAQDFAPLFDDADPVYAAGTALHNKMLQVRAG